MKWRPNESLEENCIDGYRLANASIHCGAGGLSPVTNASDGGARLCGGVAMSRNACAQPSEGLWEVCFGHGSRQTHQSQHGFPLLTHLPAHLHNEDTVTRYVRDVVSIARSRKCVTLSGARNCTVFTSHADSKSEYSEICRLQNSDRQNEN